MSSLYNVPSTSSNPPAYERLADGGLHYPPVEDTKADDIELLEYHDTNGANSTVTPSSSTSTIPATAGPSSDPAPASSSSANSSLAAFHPTSHLQIQTLGKRLCSLPTPLRPDPIPIYAVDAGAPGSAAGATTGAVPKYVSLRHTRSSGNCYLVRGADLENVDTAAHAEVLSTTTYRFGPGRPPRVTLLVLRQGSAQPPAYDELSIRSGPAGGDPFATPAASMRRRDVGDPFATPAPSVINRDNEGASIYSADNPLPGDEVAGAPAEDIEIRRATLLSRAQMLRTPLGTFGWRYAGKKERQAFASLHPELVSRTDPKKAAPNSLLLFERVVSVSIASGGGRWNKNPAREERRTVVGAFIRDDGLRTPGSSASDAGNGGRLVLDLDEEGMGPQQQQDREALEVLAVTTCLIMLKKEVDRRRREQAAVIMGGSGGP